MKSSRQRYVVLGLVPLIWFGALHQALYDYWAMALTFGWISALVIALVEVARRERQVLRFPLLISWMAIIAAAWGSVPGSFDVTTSLWEAWGWTFCMVIFYIVTNGLAAAPEIRRLLLVLSGSIVILPAWAAFHQQMVGSPTTVGAILLHGRAVWHYGRWEIHASLVNSVVMAGFFLSWGFTFWPRAPQRSLLNGMPFSLVVVGIVLSRSWTALICLVLGLLIFEIFLHRRVNRTLALQVLAFVGVVFIAAVCWKLMQDTEGQRYIPSTRFQYWKAALTMFWARPFSGVGLGAYATAFPFFKRGMGEGTLFAHGLGWQLLAETGLAGLIAYGILVGEFLTKTKCFLRTEKWSTEELSACVTLSTLLVFGLTTIYFDYLLSKVIAVIFAGYVCARLPSRVQTLLTPTMNVLVIATLVTSSSLWLTLFRAEQFLAAGEYVQAVNLNPRLGGAWAKLADLEPDPDKSRRLRLRAWRWKKDRHFLSAQGR